MQQTRQAPYYKPYEFRRPPAPRRFTPRMQALWQFCAAWMVGLALWYFHWRWTTSLNPDAWWFSVTVATAETMFLVGTLLFLYDIWSENPLPRLEAPDPNKAGGDSVDLFLTTYDEDVAIVEDSLRDAFAVRVPDEWRLTIHLLDDGDRTAFRELARRYGATYHRRDSNQGFKAGNLKNALLHSDGDFIVIADADTRLSPQFLSRTLGHFHDTKVAWVQTPHWFYDVPDMPKSSVWDRLFGDGSDPFLVRPEIFFDVIQRRRDRHGASFCCGAGSIHRREAICEVALEQKRAPASATGLEPFHFHVSEDIFTSLSIHASQSGWRSVYHPWIEAKMLSPWSLDAWAAQKMKYAGGTLDIFLNHRSPWRRSLPWSIRLHYLATFWSYISVLPQLVLMIAPIVTMFTGLAPISAYSADFFLHLLPMVIMAEIAILVGTKGYDVQASRILNIATAPYVIRALFQVIGRKKIGFRPTPKTLKSSQEYRFVRWQIGGLIAIGAAAAFGAGQYMAGNTAYTPGLLIVNGFWLAFNAMALWRVVRLGHWRPPSFDSSLERTSNERSSIA